MITVSKEVNAFIGALNNRVQNGIADAKAVSVVNAYKHMVEMDKALTAALKRASGVKAINETQVRGRELENQQAHAERTQPLADRADENFETALLTHYGIFPAASEVPAVDQKPIVTKDRMKI